MSRNVVAHISPSVSLNNTITNETPGDRFRRFEIDVEKNWRWCVRKNVARERCFCIRVRFALFLLFWNDYPSTFRFWLWTHRHHHRRMPLSLSLSSPTTKNAHAQLNGSTRPKGLGSSSPTTGAKKSSCTNRTWKRRDSAVYERYVLIWDPKRLEVTLLFWIQGEKVEFDVDAPEGERTKAINVTGPEGANVLGATRKYRRSKGGGGGNPTTTNEDAPDIGAPE